jgi:hypothetical protein
MPFATLRCQRHLLAALFKARESVSVRLVDAERAGHTIPIVG